MSNNLMQRLVVAAVALVVGLAMALPAKAQELVLPVGLGEYRQGEITDGMAQRFRFESAGPQALQLQVLSLAPELQPEVHVIDGNGILVQSMRATRPLLDRRVSLPSAGDFVIEVHSANGESGPFVLGLRSAGVFQVPFRLIPGDSFDASVDSVQTVRRFRFSAEDSPMVAMVESAGGAGPVVALRDAASYDLLALSNMRLMGVNYRIPAGEGGFLLEVMHSGSDGLESFKVCYLPAGAGGCDELAAGETCSVTPAGIAVNVRGGPGMGFGIITTLPVGASANVIGRSADFAWFNIDLNGLQGWVAGSVINVDGDCAAVPTPGGQTGSGRPPAIDPGIGNGQPPAPPPPLIDSGVDSAGQPPASDSGDDTVQNNPALNRELLDLLKDGILDGANGDDTSLHIPPGGIGGLFDASGDGNGTLNIPPGGLGGS